MVVAFTQQPFVFVFINNQLGLKISGIILMYNFGINKQQVCSDAGKDKQVFAGVIPPAYRKASFIKFPAKEFYIPENHSFHYVPTHLREIIGHRA